MPHTRLARLALISLATTSYTCQSDSRQRSADEEIDRRSPELVSAETFAHADIGAVAAPGNFGESNGMFTVAGSGADIWNTADEFHFVYRQINGDVTITARVNSLQAINVWSKAAVMVRESLSPGAKEVSTLLSPTPANKFKRQMRDVTGGTSTSIASTVDSSIPGWLRLTRTGNSFSASHSGDGVTWTALGAPVTVTMGNPVYVGLAVTSHSDGMIAAATFDRVTISGRPPAPPAGTLKLYLEAENGTLTSPLQPGADSGASNGLYWQVAPGNTSSASVPAGGHASYPFTVTTAGNYKVWGRVNAPTADDDSFWVRMDAGSWVQWNNLVNGGVWNWNDVHDSGAGGATVTYNLTAGNHTLELAYREDGAKIDRLLISNDLTATPNDAPERPSVSVVTPANGATAVNVCGFVAAEVLLPNLGGVNEATMNSTTVSLRKLSDSSLVAATANTSGGGDVIVLQPSAPLAANTQYRFSVTDGLKDVSGAPFIPFVSSFTTGAASSCGTSAFNFAKVDLGATATGFDFTSITRGPDGKVYAATLSGEIIRWTPDATGLLTAKQTITTVRDNNGGSRAVIGLAFDPAATAGNLILWVSHGASALTSAPDWSGKLTRLTGANLTSYQDFVINFPRSSRDHMTNSIAFKPGQAGVLYLNQGSMTAMGAPDNAWGLRAEHLMAGAVLRVNVAAITSPPLNLQTNDIDPAASGYNPFAAGAPVTIFASGVRNAYDLVWHSNGQLYVPTNGSAANGNTPATPATLPSACTRRVDDAVNGDYTGPQVPAITGVTAAQDDFLFRVDPLQTTVRYYGHPNPFRCEWVMNGGNPTSGLDDIEVSQYPVGTQRDRNWLKYAHDFGQHYSPNGVIEWTSNNFFSSQKGRLLVVRYSGGDDIVALTIDANGTVPAGGQAPVTGASGFADPLDLTADPVTGRIYVTEHGGRKVTLLRPQ